MRKENVKERISIIMLLPLLIVTGFGIKLFYSILPSLQRLKLAIVQN